VARMMEKRNTHFVLVGKRERKRSHVTHRRRWEDNIKIRLKVIESDSEQA
jgi:hypothetical protein